VTVLGAGAFAHHLWRINHIDLVDAVEYIEAGQRSKTVDVRFNVPDFTKAIIRDEIADKPHPEDEWLAYVFGASSVVLPDSCTARDLKTVFSARLEQHLNKIGKKARVVNLGSCGRETFTLKNTMRLALEARKPNALIFYEGHNNFGFVYGYWFMQRWLSLIWTYNPSPAALWLLQALGIDVTTFYGKLKYVYEPRWLDRLQEFHLLKFPKNIYTTLNRVAMKTFSTDIEEMADLAEQYNVPLIIITPVGNL
jgi:hypothetical protein